MRIHLKNNLAKFQLDRFDLERLSLRPFVPQQEEEKHKRKNKKINNKMSSGMRSVPDLKIAKFNF